MENRLIVEKIPSSFVKRALKLKEDTGNGEAKLFLGSNKEADKFDDFFNHYSESNNYYFNRADLLTYMENIKFEYVTEICNEYKDVGLSYFKDKIEDIKRADAKIVFKLEKFEDRSRYYIRDTKGDIFNNYLREISLPIISQLIILKDENSFLFKIDLNYDEIKSINKGLKSKIVTHNNINKPHQRIFFGAPGTGKSFQLNKEAKQYFGDNYERVTFHPNYMYGSFVGAFKPFPRILRDNIKGSGDPVKDEYGNIKEMITYEYVPGILMRMLVKALKNPANNYLLLIEEINRANIAAVFGDIFQLLDRDGTGKSEYDISTTEDQRIYLEIVNSEKGEDLKELLDSNFGKLYLPSNFYIWATMNSADQGVMPMDTAFRRRWDFNYLGINEAADENKADFEKYIIRITSNETAKWNDYRVAINKKLANLNIPEDKFIGPYFISKSVLDSGNIDLLTEIVKSKVLMYLYEDAAKAYRHELFAENKHSTFSELCSNFDKDAKNLFKGSLDLKTDSILEYAQDEETDNNEFKNLETDE